MVSIYSIAISLPRSLFEGVVVNLSQTGSQSQGCRYLAGISLSTGTEALLKSSSEIILWYLNMVLKESVNTENECLDMVSLDEEENKQPNWR